MNDENTIYDNEKVQYQSQDEEATLYDDSSKVTNNADDGKTKDTRGDEGSAWKKAAVGMGMGVLLGVAATTFSSAAPVSHSNEEEDSHPEWTDGKIPVATSVNDEMSFAEAFAAARIEVGSGGVFEWHGNIYSTYTKDEWDNMTAEEKTEYGSHFSWNSGSHHATASNPPSASEGPQTTEPEVTEENNDESSEQTTSEETDEVEVTEAVLETAGDEVLANSEDTEVEILGVTPDNEVETNIGDVVMNEQEAILIDVDGNDTMDTSDQSLIDNELGEMLSTDSYIPSDDADYTNDIVII